MTVVPPAAIRGLAFAASFALISACDRKTLHAPAPPSPQSAGGALARVGSIVISQTDLDQQLKDVHSGRSDDATRKKALDELTARAQFAQAALDAGLQNDPVVRAEIARILSSRLRETTLSPRLKQAAAPIPEARLRELYNAGQSRFQSTDKRQVAVLWLNPGPDPDRAKQYTEKLTAAREWFFKTGDLKDHPAKGFSVLAVDHSEHQPSRYRGGIVDWLERAGGSDPWSKAVAQIAFSLEKPGDVSPVISRPEGLFLVRYIAETPASLRTFEAVAAELERAERQRLRERAEQDFADSIRAKYPVELQAPPKP
jgi:PPIC-type PPIASE domain